MRKTLITITMGLALLPQMSKAQVYDEEKRLQWRSMETGPLEFEPRFYYWLFHNSYAHHEWEWEWHGLFHSGFYLNLKPHKSDAKPLLPKRTLGAATDEWTRESTDAQEKNFKHQLEQETLAAADRRIDAAYLLFKDDFDEMQQKIAEARELINMLKKTVTELDDGGAIEGLVDKVCDKLGMPMLKMNPLFSKSIDCLR